VEVAAEAAQLPPSNQGTLWLFLKPSNKANVFSLIVLFTLDMSLSLSP
jgi:hypothetical protein